MSRPIALLFTLLLLSSCTFLAQVVTAEKQPSRQPDTPLEQRTHQYFWNQLHQGHYDSLGEVIDRLHYAYQQDPRDFKIAAHLGFAYVWQITERARLDTLRPSIAATGDLSQRYFSEAVALNPNDPRLRGFQAGLMLVNGSDSRHADPELATQGYFLGQKAIRQWPSFNLFSIGYVMSVLDHQSERYQEALDYQWRNLEECLCRKVDREHPDLSDLDQIPARVADDELKSRACTNGWIAPHNVEGFLLNLGDMLVKRGDTAQARAVYQAIRQVAGFEAWPYRDAFEQRLQHLTENVANFRQPVDQVGPDQQVFIRTRFGCMGCHQKSEAEFEVQNVDIPLSAETYFLTRPRE